MIPAAAAGIWQDVECGAYADDLGLWEELAQAAPGPVLELGCGTGRVLVHLARRGYEVAGIDSDPELVPIANARLREVGSEPRASVADARDLDLGQRFGLVVAAMEFAQLLHGAAERGRLLDGIRRHLVPGGRAAFALVGDLTDTGPEGQPQDGPLPDVRERDGWVYSSLPLSVHRDARDLLVIERLRQMVAPDGRMSDVLHVDRLDLFTPDELQAEAERAGLRPIERHPIPPSEMYSASDVVIVEAP